MSPEQTLNADVDARSDLFSAGVVLYEIVAGQRPFAGDHPSAVLYAIANEDPQPLRRYNNRASDSLERLVTKLLAKDPESRYPSAKGVLVDLRAERREGGLPARPQARSRKGMWIGAAVIAVTLVAVGVWLAGGGGEPNAPVTVSTPQTLAGPEENSIAVLPFADMSPDKDHEYFCDGISEELLNMFSKLPELRVAARTSSFSFKGKEVAIPEIARQLNVAHILEGSVRKAGDRVRITAQLIHADDGYHLWSDTYDRTLDDIFAIQDDIAADVVAQLKVRLLGEALQVRETDPRAYALYLQARHLDDMATPENYEKAIELFKQALAIDPEYPPAWGGLSRAYVNQAQFGLRPVDEGFEMAREADQKALAIDPDFATAHAGLGWIATFHDGDLAAAARHYERALRLEPRNIRVIANASALLSHLGRSGERIALLEYAVVRDPVNPTSHWNLGHTYLRTGRWNDAIESFRTTLTLSPGRAAVHSALGQALMQKGDPRAALEAIQLESFEAYRLIRLAMVYHDLEQESESDAALAELIEKYEKDAAYNVAYVLAYRNEADRAFEWLDKAVEYNDPGLSEIATENLFANLYNDPRWLPFLESIGRSPGQLAAIEFSVTLPE